MHRRGPLIDITNSQKRHFFFQNPNDRARVIRLMALTRGTIHRTNGDCRFVMDMVGQTYGTVPQNLHHHYEYTVPAGQPNHVTRTHHSGGVVHVNVRPTQQQVIRLIDRLLSDGAAVEVDRNVQVALAVQVPRPPIVGAAAYLASL
jgi:hypothetical protein